MERFRGRSSDRRTQGSRDGRRLPGGVLELAEDRPARPDRRELIPEPTDKNVVKAVRKLAKEADSVVIATDFDREGELIGHEALQQAMESNPEIVAGRDRGAPGRQARPLLGAHQGRDRARLRRARRALLRPRLRRRRPPGHRPDLGRHADPRGLARHPPLRLQLPLRRPRPEPDPRRSSSSASSSAAPTCPSPSGRSSRSSSIPTARSRRTTRPTSSGRRPRRRPRSPARRAPASSRT